MGMLTGGRRREKERERENVCVCARGTLMGMLTGPRATRESETTRKSKQFQPSFQKGRNLRARASRLRHAARLRNICRNAGAVQHLLNAAMQRPLRLMRFHAIHAMPRSVRRRRDLQRRCGVVAICSVGAASSRFAAIGAASSRSRGAASSDRE